MIHKLCDELNNHIITSFIFLDELEKDFYIYSVTDIGKVVRVGESFYLIQNVDPLTGLATFLSFNSASILGTGLKVNQVVRLNKDIKLENSKVLIEDEGELHGYLAKINYQTDNFYTLQLEDSGKIIDHSNASLVTVTLPPSLPQGWGCTYFQSGEGEIYFLGSITSYLNKGSLAGRGAACTIWVRSNTTGSNAEYCLAGQLV